MYKYLQLTRWCLKKVFREKHATPMCLKICNTLLAEPPATRIAKLRNRFPAGIFVSGKIGWLFQMNFLAQFGLQHKAVTSAIVPICLVSRSGSGSLQKWQNLNRLSMCDRNTINFGSVRMSVSLMYTLMENQM